MNTKEMIFIKNLQVILNLNLEESNVDSDDEIYFWKDKNRSGYIENEDGSSWDITQIKDIDLLKESIEFYSDNYYHLWDLENEDLYKIYRGYKTSEYNKYKFDENVLLDKGDE